MNKFHKLGTKHKTYVSRFLDKYKDINRISFNIIDDNSIDILVNEHVIDHFTSKTTFKQFFLVIEALGMIEKTPSGYNVIQDTYEFKKVTDAIFEKCDDQKVMLYRGSRILCLLYSLNLIGQKYIDDNKLTKTKGALKVEDLVSETSKWEEDAMSSIDNVLYVLERIKNEYKI